MIEHTWDSLLMAAVLVGLLVWQCVHIGKNSRYSEKDE